MVLQMAITEAAAERITPAILAELDANIKRTEEVAEDPAAVTELDAEFSCALRRRLSRRLAPRGGGARPDP